MKVPSPFNIREQASAEILELLTSVTLGTNGAKYRHLDTAEKVKQLYKPMFLTLERVDKVLGNITFCRRPCGWYIRYFAFDQALQSKGKKNNTPKENSWLKKQLNQFFQEALQSEETDSPILFYAYIDPKNVKSLWISEQFGFTTMAKIATQTFSRIKPRKKELVQKSPTKWAKSFVLENFGNYPLFFPHHVNNDAPSYVLKNEAGEIIAFAKTQRAIWCIERLSGRSGALLTQIIPFIPGVRKIVKPNRHEFSTVEAVWVANAERANATELLEKLFEGILYLEKTNSLVWWVDYKEPLYQAVQKRMNWGLMHKLNGVSDAHLVMLHKAGEKPSNAHPFYATAFDFI
jgi:hypothetical protein